MIADRQESLRLLNAHATAFAKARDLGSEDDITLLNDPRETLELYVVSLSHPPTLLKTEDTGTGIVMKPWLLKL